MDPRLRSALLGTGVGFCVFFALLSIEVAVHDGIDILTVVSLVVIGMIGAALIGAIRNPPPE